jgi:hypothetical protein
MGRLEEAIAIADELLIDNIVFTKIKGKIQKHTRLKGRF